jgi:hypothetical protein
LSSFDAHHWPFGIALPLLFVLGGAAGSAVAARPGAVACATVKGPCDFVDTEEVVLRPGGAELALSTNFGLLLPAPDGKGFEIVCEESYGGPFIRGIQMDGGGRLFVPNVDGLYVSPPGACGFERAGGSVFGQLVYDLAVDPENAPENAPGKAARIWVLTGDPPALHVSLDGGRTFTQKQAFDVGFQPQRLLLAPSDAETLYVAGRTQAASLVLHVSRDGAGHFTMETGGGFERRQHVAFLGIHPRQPQTLFIALAGQTGADEIWRSTDGGRNWIRVLTLRGEIEAVQGFAIAPDGTALFVAGRELLPIDGDVPARLYVSRDGGGTWQEPVASPASGPRYRCLGFREGKLYACAGDEKDAFLLGVSADEGRSWTPLVTLRDVAGPKTCSAAACVATMEWLCRKYLICERGDLPDAAVSPGSGGGDGGAADAGQGCASGGACGAAQEGGCACALGGGESGGIGWLAVPLALLGWLGFRRLGPRRRGGRGRP